MFSKVLLFQSNKVTQKLSGILGPWVVLPHTSQSEIPSTVEAKVQFRRILTLLLCKYQLLSAMQSFTAPFHFLGYFHSSVLHFKIIHAVTFFSLCTLHAFITQRSKEVFSDPIEREIVPGIQKRMLILHS